MAIAMTTQQVTDLRHHTAKLRKIYDDLELKAKNEWGDGTNPNLTLHLELDCFKQALSYLDLANEHHIQENV